MSTQPSVLYLSFFLLFLQTVSNEITLVGLDFGTTTSSAAVATARLVQSAVTRRRELSEIREVFRSEMVFTPFDANDSIGPAEIPLKRRYVYTDAFRLAALWGLKIEGPPKHPFNPLKALRLVTAATDPKAKRRLAVAVCDAAWRDGLAFIPLRDRTASRTVGLITRSIERHSPAEEAFAAQLRLTLREKAAELGIQMLGRAKR